MNILDRDTDHIKEASENNFYGLDPQAFFTDVIIAAIKQIPFNIKSHPTAIGKDMKKNIEKKFFKSYLKRVATPLEPTEKLLKQINFIGEEHNSHLQSELIENIAQLFTTKNLLSAINDSSEKMAKVLSIAMRNAIDQEKYKAIELTEHLSILTNEKNRDIFVKEIILTNHTGSYIIIEKALDLNKEKKELMVRKILIKNTQALLLHRDIVKQIFVKTLEKDSRKILDSYIENLNITKIDFLIDIFKESKKETQDLELIQKIDKLIYKTIEKALTLKDEVITQRIIEIKREDKGLTDFDIYVLMVKRFYSYYKKEKAQTYAKQILEVAKENEDLENLAPFLFGHEQRYKIKALDIEVNIGEGYFRHEMKSYFMNYLEQKLPVKNNKIKATKI